MLLRRRLCPADYFLVVVIAIALVGTVLAVGERRARANLELRLSRATLRLQAEACKQRQVLVSAIQTYKATLGSYPPDHVVHRSPLIVDPVTNQLMYELFGTLYNSTNDSFLPHQFPRIKGTVARRFFNVDTFKNSAEKPELVKQFLDKTNVVAEFLVQGRPDVVALLGMWPNWEGMDSDLYQFFDAVSWRYNCSCPAHNPGSFDLWIQIKTSRTNIVIGNW
jgi:hypothetical protein